MRIFLTLLAITGACLAYPEDDDNKYGMHYSQHRSSVDTARQGMQERLSKLEARTSYNQIGVGGSENFGTGCTIGCPSGASSAYSSRLSSSSNAHRSSSSNALENSEYRGIGTVGHNHLDDSDLQQRVSSRYSGAGSAFEADDLQQKQVPGDLSNVQASAYRQASRNSYREEEEENEEDLQKNVGAGYHDLSVNNDRYLDSQSQRRTQYQKESESRVTSGGRPVYYVPAGSSSTSFRSSAANSESQYSESRTQKPVPVGQFVSMAVRPGTATVLAIPVSAQDVNQQRIQSNRRDYQAVTELSRTRVQPGYQINYYPAYTSERTSSSGSRTDSESSRTTTQQKPEKLITNEYSASRYNNEESEEEETQQRISPVVPVIGSTRHSSSTGASTNYQQGFTSGRVVPAVPVHTVELTASQKAAAEEREQRRYSQSRPSYTHRTAASRNENEQSSASQYSTVNRPVYPSSRVAESDGSQYGSSGSTVYTAPINSHSRSQMQAHNQQGSSQSQYQAGSAAQNQYQTAGGAMRTNYGGYNSYPAYSRTTGSNAQRGSAGSTQSRFNSHTASTNNGDLMEFMSESERLARVQQGQVAGSSQSSSQSALSAMEANRRTVNTASNLDSAAASFVSSSNNLSSRLSDTDNVENLAGTGGYKRVKSWQKQSKWASGSEYGTDGAPKSYSMLSTAESEKHNINGAETGYKAATTTLENDGKVSTYSIHTP